MKPAKMLRLEFPVNVSVPNDRGPGPSQKFDRDWLVGWAEAHREQSPLARCVLELVAENRDLVRYIADENERLTGCVARARDCSMRNEWLQLADDGCPHVEVG